LAHRVGHIDDEIYPANWSVAKFGDLSGVELDVRARGSEAVGQPADVVVPEL
jgi:hypothetical protein